MSRYNDRDGEAILGCGVILFDLAFLAIVLGGAAWIWKQFL